MSKMLGYMILGSLATMLMQYMCYHRDSSRSAMEKIQEENEKAMSWLKNKFK